MSILAGCSLSGYRRVALGLLVAMLFGFLLTASGCVPSAQDSGSVEVKASALESAPEIGHMAPDFTLIDLDGNQLTLSDLRGKTVFLNFWATWCPPCRAEMSEIEAISQKYKDAGVAVFVIDLREPESDVLRFVQEGGYSWSFVIDRTGEVGKTYGVTLIPTSFFLDKEGVIRAVNIGAITRQTMEISLAEAMR